MKIVHICQYYNDGYGYQENLLPKYQAKLGHEVVVITSDRGSYFIGEKKPKIVSPGQYTDNGIRIIRLGISREFKGRYVRFINLFDAIKRECPDYIFHHGLTAPSVFEVVKYKQEYPQAKTALDNHGDYANSGRFIFWRLAYYRFYWKSRLKRVHSTVDRYFSITPHCKAFAENELGVPSVKHVLLPLGVDEEMTYYSPEWRKSIRKHYGIQEADFTIITLGKFNKRKKLEVLIEVIKRLNNKRVKLFIVGSFLKGYDTEIDSLIGNASGFIKIGWVEQNQIYKYLSAADLAVFPGGQSVIWQQAISTGLPTIFQYWPGIEYLKIREDIDFLRSNNVEELVTLIQTAYNRFVDTKSSHVRYNDLSFSYRKIASMSIEEVFTNSKRLEIF